MRALLLIVAMLAACDRTKDQGCLDLAVYPPAGITDQRQTTFACVEQWAARLAKGPDSPDDAAKAAVTKCERAIQYLSEQDAKVEMGSLAYNQIISGWTKQAHAIVVEARARGCYS